MDLANNFRCKPCATSRSQRQGRTRQVQPCSPECVVMVRGGSGKSDAGMVEFSQELPHFLVPGAGLFECVGYLSPVPKESWNSLSTL